MTRKRYSDTINPQIAVQDYLDDLLQKLPSTSPLDKLREEDEAKAKAANNKAQQIAAEKPFKTESSARPQSTYSSMSTGYTAGRETSLAAQRLEKKRALARVPQRDFREPLAIKSSPLLKEMPKLQQASLAPQPKLTEKPLASPILAKQPEVPNLKNEPPATIARAEPLDLPEVQEPAISQPTTKRSESAERTRDIESPLIEPVENNVYSDKWLENGRPEWAQGRFECLIFTVAGLKLAVPLVSLGAIHTIDQELTPLVGRPSWFLGLLPVGDKNIRVVDSALWIMPERYNDSVKDGYRFVIRLDNSEWGMACDSVAQSFSIAPEEVRWRTDRGKRPWLAGTVIDHMCALMDVAAVAHLLDTAEKTNNSPI